ncbi:MAG: F0F1 ATP synthase subunit B [Myxococcaceae bacterium]|nr:F0F1 ATP synthase subunit B [Myxococcaceae bacterium]
MKTLVLAAGFTDVQPGLIFWTLITFIIVAFVLKRVAWGPILTAVEEREKQIAGAIESAKHERAQAEKLLNEQKTAIAQARQEAAEEVRKNQAAMEKFREDMMAKSRKEAEDYKAEARRTIDEERRKASAELKGEAVNIAIAVAEKLMVEKLDDAKHRQLAEQFITDLSKGMSQKTAA